MTDVKSLFKGVGKSFLWCFLGLFFGLLQLWVMLLYSWFDTKHLVTVEMLIKDCGILFFCTGLATSFGVECFFNKKTVENLGVFGLIYVFFPLLIVLLSIVLYGICYLSTPKYASVRTMELVILFATCVYAFFLKRQEFSNQ